MEMDYRHACRRPGRGSSPTRPIISGTPLLTGWLTQRALAAVLREYDADVSARGGGADLRQARRRPLWAAGRGGRVAERGRLTYHVGRQAFVPPPNVTSAVVHLVPMPAEEGLAVKHVERSTKARLRQRRKMVRAIAEVAGCWWKGCWPLAGLKGDERAEDLPIEAFRPWARALPGLR